MDPSSIALLIALSVGAGAVIALVTAFTPTRTNALRRRLLEHLALCARRGLPLGPAVTALADEVRPRSRARALVEAAVGRAPTGSRQAALLDGIAGTLDATGSLAGALDGAPELGLGPERGALLHAAERRGALPEVLAQLADEHLALEEARSAVLVVTAYPAILCALLLGVATFMTVVIQPRFREIFLSMAVDPGPLFQAWDAAEDAAPAAGVALVVLLVLVTAGPVRAWCLRAAERAPLLGGPVRRWRAGLALQRVSAFLRAGATLPEAFDEAGRAAIGGAARGAADAAALAREGRPPLAAIERLLGRDAPALAPRVALEVERAPAFVDGVLAAGTAVAARARADLAGRLHVLRAAPIVACALVVGAMQLAVWTPILRLQTYLLEDTP